MEGAVSAQRSVFEKLLLKSGLFCGGGKRLPSSWPLGMKSGCRGVSMSLSEGVRVTVLSKTACNARETDDMGSGVDLIGAVVGVEKMVVGGVVALVLWRHRP